MDTRIAIAQINASSDPQQNLRTAARMAAQAAQKQAHLLMLPEYTMTYPDHRLPDGVPFPGGQPLDGAFVSGLRELAAAHRLWITCGVIEQAPDDPRPYNTTVVISDQGELVASHRKCQLYDAFSYRESDHFRPGMSRFTPIQTPFGTLGLIVCYELRYPELARLQTIEGAEFLLVTAAFVCGKQKAQQWHTLLAARAVENGCFVLGCNHVKPRVFLGESSAYAPDGQTIMECGDTPELIVVTCDRSQIGMVRENCPVLRQRREDLYSLK